MPLTAYGRPLNIRPLSGAISLPRQQQAAPPTLAGWGRPGTPVTDTLAKPTANFASARPPQGVPAVSAWANANAPQSRGVTLGQPSFTAAMPRGTTLTGTPSAQRIPVGQGDPTVVRTPAGTRLTPSLTRSLAPTQREVPRVPGRPSVTHASPGYTPRGPTGSPVIELVENSGVWSPGTGYQPAGTPSSPTTAGGTPADASGASQLPAPAAVGYSPPQTAGASAGSGEGAPAGDESSVAPPPAAGRPWWQYALGAALVGGVVYAAMR